MMNPRYCMLQWNKRRVGIDADRVVELVSPTRPVVRVPSAPTGVSGVMNYGGQMVPVLGDEHGASSHDDSAAAWCRLVVSTVAGLVCLQAYDVEDVVEEWTEWVEVIDLDTLVATAANNSNDENEGK